MKEVWANNRMKNRFSSSVLFDGHIYGFDEAIFGCMNAETGELKWKGGRYGYGQVVLAGGNLVVMTEQGEAVLIKPSPERLQEVSRFQAVSGRPGTTRRFPMECCWCATRRKWPAFESLRVRAC